MTLPAALQRRCHPGAAGAAPRAPGAAGPRLPLAAAAAGQAALLAALQTATGMGAVGWPVGIAYAAALCALLSGALRRGRERTLGPADRVTLARAVLVGGVAALVAAPAGGTAPMVVLSAVALVLDGADGWVARRTGTASPFGARFDMEVDAFLILVLSVHLAASLGAWVLAIGAMRYAFAAAALAVPGLRAPLPPARARKTVAAVQGIVLTAACAALLPRPAATLAVAAALALLAWSFGRDIAWLSRAAHRSGAAPSRAARCSPNAATSAARRSLPLRAEASEGRPTTPDSE